MAVDKKKTEAPKGAESTAYTFVTVCRSDELPEGEVRQLKARGKELAVGRLVGGQLFAVGGRCTHLRARLGKGTMNGTILACPWHGAQFSVENGEALAPPAPRSVSTYPVRVTGGFVEVEV